MWPISVGIGGHVQLHLSADHVGHALRSAFVRDVRELDARRFLEGLGSEVGDGAVAGTRVVDAARIGLRGLHHVGQRLVRRFGARHDHQRRAGDQADRRQVLHRIVGKLGVQRRVDREVAGLPHHQRVAVPRRLGRGIHAEVAAGAGLVVHHEGVAGVPDLVGELARDDVRAAAGGEGHDQADGPGGPTLSERGGGSGDERGGCDREGRTTGNLHECVSGEWCARMRMGEL